MITSKITGKSYQPTDCIFISNMTQCHQMLNAIGPADLYDILYTSEKRPDALVFVWAKMNAQQSANAYGIKEN